MELSRSIVDGVVSASHPETILKQTTSSKYVVTVAKAVRQGIGPGMAKLEVSAPDKCILSGRYLALSQFAFVYHLLTSHIATGPAN